jgi:hypothetical protein
MTVLDNIGNGLGMAFIFLMISALVLLANDHCKFFIFYGDLPYIIICAGAAIIGFALGYVAHKEYPSL